MEMKEMTELRDQGILTEAEFVAEKKKILAAKVGSVSAFGAAGGGFGSEKILEPWCTVAEKKKGLEVHAELHAASAQLAGGGDGSTSNPLHSGPQATELHNGFPAGKFYITNRESGMNVVVAWDYSCVQLWERNESAAQTWEFNRESGCLINIGSGKALDISGGALEQGAVIHIWDPNSSAAQQWSYDAEEGFVYASAGDGAAFVMDIANGVMENGTDIRLWDNNGSEAQRFVCEPVSSTLKSLVDDTGSHSDFLPFTDGRKSLFPIAAFTFALIDTDRSGFIEIGELAAMIQMAAPNPAGMTAASVMTEVDTSGDGRISKEEIIKYFETQQGFKLGMRLKHNMAAKDPANIKKQLQATNALNSQRYMVSANGDIESHGVKPQTFNLSIRAQHAAVKDHHKFNASDGAAWCCGMGMNLILALLVLTALCVVIGLVFGAFIVAIVVGAEYLDAPCEKDLAPLLIAMGAIPFLGVLGYACCVSKDKEKREEEGTPAWLAMLQLAQTVLAGILSYYVFEMHRNHGMDPPLCNHTLFKFAFYWSIFNLVNLLLFICQLLCGKSEQ
jgi:hypothetical protein